MFSIEIFKNKYALLTLVFFISLTVHLLGLNKIGRTWDEAFKVETGYMALTNFASGNFSYNSWNFVPEHPMVGKYAYSLVMGPQTIRVDDGKGHIANLAPTDVQALMTGNYIKTQLENKLYMVSYDYTAARFLSAVFNSLAVTFTVLIALYFLSSFWAFMAGVFMLVMPRFVVMGQLVTFESLSVFLFTMTVLVFYKLLNKPRDIRLYILTGILCGLLFWTRYNNYFIFVFLGGWTTLHYFLKRKKEIFNFRLILIPVIAFFLGIVIWPLVWNDFPKHLIESFLFHKGRILPSIYYLNRIIVTTPIPVLVGLVLGIFFAIREKKYWTSFWLYWFFLVLIWHMVLGIPGGGTRFIFIIYPSIAVLCAYGYFKILKKNWIYALIPIFVYMIINMLSYHPYYLDYYNSLVNGVSGAAKRGYEVSWWGEGQRDVGDKINEIAPKGSSVGYIVIPRYVAPSTRLDINNMGFVDTKTKADYVMVSRWRIQELSEEFLKNYEAVYQSKVRNEPLVLLYKKKSSK